MVVLLHSFLKGGEGLYHILWRCSSPWMVWGCFLEAFGFQLARQRGCRVMLKEFLLHLPFSEKERFLWQACAYVGSMRGKK